MEILRGYTFHRTECSQLPDLHCHEEPQGKARQQEEVRNISCKYSCKNVQNLAGTVENPNKKKRLDARKVSK